MDTTDFVDIFVIDSHIVSVVHNEAVLFVCLVFLTIRRFK